MRRLLLLLIITLVSSAMSAETLRGPLEARLVVNSETDVEAVSAGLEGIVLIEVGGDVRFLDAVELEIGIPAVVAEYPGAFILKAVGPTTLSERAGIVDIVGPELLFQALTRGGRAFYQIPLREDVPRDASAAVTVLDGVVAPDSFPIALTVVARMKGLDQEILDAVYEMAVRPVVRDVGAVNLQLITDEGTEYDGSEYRVPDFQLDLDGNQVDYFDELLLSPGLHTITLTSQMYQDQEVTFGVERGRVVDLEVPLLLALATVTYSTPRGARVYVDGRAMEGPDGDFTVLPGEHTMIVTIGGFTVTKRFTVEESREYSMSVLMDIEMEEIK